jgi:hypothetical protein
VPLQDAMEALRRAFDACRSNESLKLEKTKVCQESDKKHVAMLSSVLGMDGAVAIKFQILGAMMDATTKEVLIRPGGGVHRIFFAVRLFCSLHLT